MERVRPDRDTVKALAKSGAYRRIPVCRELFADCITPIEALRRLRQQSSHCFMLESAEASERWGRYTFLGYRPTVELTCTDGLLSVTSDVEGTRTVETRRVTHPKDAIRELIADYKSAKIDGLPPFTGGLVGFFSYDYIHYAEPTLKLASPEAEGAPAPDFPDVDLMLFDRIIVFDSYRQKLLLICGVDADDVDGSYPRALAALDEMEATLKDGAPYPFPPLHLEEPLAPALSDEAYAAIVERAKHYIYEGDIFQVVLSNPLGAEAEGSLFDAYRILRTENPSPYMFYFSSNDIEVVGASPETLIKLTDGVLYTYPLAGTRPRGATPEEDRALEADLREDEKELAEHDMLVDLGRNDIGRISEVGTVQVETYQSVLRFSRVMHLGSTVVGHIAPDKDALDAVDSILPAGTLSGAPKLRACEIIEELEPYARGIYGGAIGYLDFTGNLDTCIAIRLAYQKRGHLQVRSGAGIVADSDPASEARECRHKARAVVEAIEASEGGLSQ